MMPYAFFREDGFYILNLLNDAAAISNAECNPGTIRVMNGLGIQVWPQN